MHKVLHIAKEIGLYILKVVGILFGILFVAVVLPLSIFAIKYHIEMLKIPDYMIEYGQEKVYIPDGNSDLKYHDGFADKAWKYFLDDEEMSEALKYLEDYPEAWHQLDEYALSFIAEVYHNPGGGIYLDDIVGHEAYYCFVDPYSQEFSTVRKSTYYNSGYAYFIIDVTENSYYAIHDSGW